MLNLASNFGRSKTLRNASDEWGATVEDVRTIFERRNDATVYIPALEYVEK